MMMMMIMIIVIIVFVVIMMRIKIRFAFVQRIEKIPIRTLPYDDTMHAPMPPIL